VWTTVVEVTVSPLLRCVSSYRTALGVVWCLTGESVDDCGGGYSESIAEMCDELQNGSRCDV